MGPMKCREGFARFARRWTRPVTPIARYAPMLAVLGVAVARPSPSLASAGACPPVPAEMDLQVNAHWPDLRGRIIDALADRRDVDGCARIAIRLPPRTIVAAAARAAVPPVIVLEVVLRDGRSASRSVARAEDVIPTLEALLLLPEAAASWPDDPVSEAAEPVRAPAPPRERDTATVVFAPTAAAASAQQPRPFGIEFSLAAGARIGDGQAGVGLGALTVFEVRGWLVGFEGSADQYQPLHDGSPAAMLKLAVLAGRRFQWGGTALDLTAGPALAVNGFGTRVAVKVESDASARPAPPETDGVRKRLVCGARLTFRPRAVVRTFVGVDGELALDRSPVALVPDKPQLPAWTAGVVVGFTVGTP